MRRRPYSFLIFTVATAWGQSIAAGVKLGAPITEYFETGATQSLHGSANYSAATRRYTFGPSAEWRWTKSIGFEVDALYHRMGYVGIVHYFDSATGFFQDSAIDVKGNSWDFPVMLKYRFGRAVRPYVAGGGVFRHIGPVRGRGEQTTGTLVTRMSTTMPLDTSDPSELRKRFYPGVTAVGGVEGSVGRVRISAGISLYAVDGEHLRPGRPASIRAESG